MASATNGATRMPPKERPVAAIENASARRTLNQRATTVVKGTRPAAPWQNPNTTWKA